MRPRGEIFGYAAAARRQAVLSYWIILFHTTDCRTYIYVVWAALFLCYKYKSAVEQSGVWLENCFRAEKPRKEKSQGLKCRVCCLCTVVAAWCVLLCVCVLEIRRARRRELLAATPRVPQGNRTVNFVTRNQKWPCVPTRH